MTNILLKVTNPDFVKKVKAKTLTELRRENKQSGQKILSLYKKGIKDLFKSGNLQAGATIQIERKGALVIVFNVMDYSDLVEKGTAAHFIQPKTKKVLKFHSNKSGSFVFAKFVAHPGTKPVPAMLRAYATLMVPRSKFNDRVKARLAK